MRAAAPSVSASARGSLRRSGAPCSTALLLLLAAACGPLDGDLQDDGTAAPTASDALAAGATYTFVGVQSNLCVEVRGSSTATLAPLQIGTCNGGRNQQFTLQAVTGGFFQIRNLNSNLCVDVNGASTADGAAIIQWTCGGGTNQQWSITDVSTGVVRFTARHSGKVIDVNNRGTTAGTPLIQWTWGGGTNQQFRAQLVSGGGTGAGGSGGTTGGGGGGSGGTTGGGGGSTTCGVSPVNPNATAQARKLLCYIYSQYGNHVLSGQQETSWSNPADDISFYTSNFGKAPAILGGDYLYPSGTSSRAIAYWQAGGIPMIRYHMGNPPNADSYENSLGSANLANVLTSGTTENRSFLAKLDYAAAEIKKLQDAGVALVWAPFHEAQPNGWFWWSKGTGAQYTQLWRTMYSYFTTTKGLNNILWLMPFSGSPNSSFYPGKAFVDLGGPDTYATNPPFSSLFNTARGILGSSLPIPLHETGTIPNPATMFPSSAPWVLFNVWAGYQRNNNSLAAVRTTYDSPFTVTRDEVPNLR